MPAVLAIAGHSRSGKTSLIERLVPELRRRGLRVAAVKHTHKDVQADQPGKDSWRFAEAGCEQVALSGRRTLALFRRPEDDPPFEALVHWVGGDCDLVLIEGLHTAPVAKIEVHRRGIAPELRSSPADLLAVVTDEPLEVACPQFSPNDITKLADLIVGSVVSQRGTEAALWVNGSPVPIGNFTQRILAGTLHGLIAELKGVGEVKTLEVRVRTGAEHAAPDDTR